jgi:ATP-dependent Clp protease ATP-binding subunit ClpC
MFERFTKGAREVVVFAQDEARTLKHDYIGTEHVLLGLLRAEEGVAAAVLDSLDITVEEVRDQVARIIGPGDEVTTGQIPFTPRARKVLELALREALSLGHKHIGTEHILLALVRENEGMGARILLEFDADAEKIRDETLRVLSRAEQVAGTRAAGSRMALPTLRVGCPRCGAPLDSISTAGIDERPTGTVRLTRNGPAKCPACEASWTLTYDVRWDEVLHER